MQQPSPDQYPASKSEGFSFDPNQNGLSKGLQVKLID